MGELRNEFLNKLLLYEKKIYITSLNKKIKLLKFLFTSPLKTK